MTPLALVVAIAVIAAAPVDEDPAVRVAIVTSSFGLIASLVTGTVVIVSAVIARRRTKGETQQAVSADARSDSQLELEGFRSDAESARAGQASAIALVAATREHYVALLQAHEQQAAGLQSTIDSLLEVNRGLTESLRIAQTQPAGSAALVASLEEQLRLTGQALLREQQALVDADGTIADLRTKVLNLEHELVEATAGNVTDIRTGTHGQ